jgi:hypothetical protein
MFSLLFYEAESEPPTALADLGELLDDLPGITWEAPPGAAYRPARWRDPATGARATWDVGQPPLHAEPGAGGDEPPRTYSGWRHVPLACSIPLVGPHWLAVTVLAQVAKLLTAAPHLVPLDLEDTRKDGESDAGPFPFDRPRAIASWEHQREDAITGLNLPRLDRRASLALWRYRVERTIARAAHPTHHWPEGLALLDRETQTVRTACLWTDPEEPFVLPPVELIVVRGEVVPADELRLLTSADAPGGARLLDPAPAVTAFYRGAKTLPTARFQGLGDEDWID